MEQLSYEESGIDQRILRAVKEMGFEQMTPIQAQAIPVLLERKDIIGQAQTGTGKTAAFGIPVIQNIDIENKNTQAIILCPTRELAIQAAEELRKLAKFMHGIKVLPIYGGQDIEKQIRSLKSDVQIIVGTPGRVMDHMRRRTLKLDHVEIMVLDEADEMLNMGFREDIETILEKVPNEHQTALFSATMPKAILDITNKYQKDAVMVKMVKKELTIPLVDQFYYEINSKNKNELLCRLLDYYNPKLSLVFCNTKRSVDELVEVLKGRGYFAEGLHGDMSQRQRDTVMARFRKGTVDILIATDVAARGIDVNDITAVFNYDMPQDVEYYVHRIGRTGRAGKTGKSFSFVSRRELYKVREIEQSCKTKIKQKAIPTAADVTLIKSEKVLKQALEVLKENELEYMIKIIEQKLEEEDCTTMELAAAFLKMNMGEEIQEIPKDDFSGEKSNRRRSGQQQSSGGRSGGGRPRRTSEKGYDRRGERSYDRGTDKKNDKKSERKSEKKYDGRKSERKGGKSAKR